MRAITDVVPRESTPSFHPFRSEQARAEYDAHCKLRTAEWPVPAEAVWPDTRFGRTLVRVSGRATDPPLVVLHGARAGSLMWLDMIATLAAGHRVYAPDIIGDAGYSVASRPIAKMEDYVEWLDDLLAALVPDRPVCLLGLSMGGGIAGLYAARRPERLRALVLLAPGATVLRFAPGFFVRMALLVLAMRALGRSSLRRTMQWLFADALQGDAACRARVERAIEDAERVVRVFRLPHPPWPPVLSDETWRALSVPCLFLAGENEKIYSAAAAVRRLSRVAPQVRVEIVPGCGHDLTIVYPELVARKVIEFLADMERIVQAAGARAR